MCFVKINFQCSMLRSRCIHTSLSGSEVRSIACDMHQIFEETYAIMSYFVYCKLNLYIYTSILYVNLLVSQYEWKK